MGSGSIRSIYSVISWGNFGSSALVGLVAGILADRAWEISFLAGYAGTDFWEGLYKLRFGQFFNKS